MRFNMEPLAGAGREIPDSVIESGGSAVLGETASVPLDSQLSRLIFVGGSPRSGTTLVQRILNCHPEIYGGPEFDYVPQIAALFEEMRRAVRSGRIDAILAEDTLVQVFRNVLTGLFLPKLCAEGVTYLSEKTPNNVLAFPWLEECVPEAKKILVIRDPRDVVSSMLQVGLRQRQRRGRAGGGLRDTIMAVSYMNKFLRAGTAVAERSANCLVVHYEDVVSDLLGSANRMYRFIGVGEMDKLHLESEHFDTARDHDSWADWLTPETMRSPLQTDRVGVAKRQLTRSDWDYISRKTIYHPLLVKRYSIPLPGWTLAARWCIVRSLAARIQEGVTDLRARFRRWSMEWSA